MNQGRLIFSQITDVFHREQFQRCVAKYPMPRTSRSFFARDQFLTMAFAQLTYRASLRDVEACLSGNPTSMPWASGGIPHGRTSPTPTPIEAGEFTRTSPSYLLKRCALSIRAIPRLRQQEGESWGVGRQDHPTRESKGGLLSKFNKYGSI